ncbi:unnamed protein product [Rotaria socialis]|uniref:Uncharacterized protein n=1 Tax=Rotaria socialis TaxID=392032 RepID=A0A820HIH0_9BILA|nr:unnamed protein product [Rotaria socialis]CAF3364452.1 unnamed protein product [Rotaria socialis]CAF3492752.1 unnamed protein product [Rotaria socialis]CAF3701702.1 unnamed protein product [Rotaria socialis]CAF3705890.1 unnamed protein product [Rotaria socialis]
MYMITSGEPPYFNENLSPSFSSPPSLCANENCTNDISSSIATNTFPNSLVIIFILSILCLFGVCFMIFGPLQRSEAHKRIENYTFGLHPIFNVDNRKQSSTTRYDESMEFSSI